MPVYQIAVGGFDNNFSYIATAANGDCIIVDPTGNTEKIREAFEKHCSNATPRYILITHSHMDHTSGIVGIRNFFDAPVCAASSKSKPDILINDKDFLAFGSSGINILSTPGHSQDSICYIIPELDAIFTGDTVFIDCIGYCKPEIMFNTIQKTILPLPDELILYSGHDYGHVPFESLGAQKKSNPYLAAKTFEDFMKAIKEL